MMKKIIVISTMFLVLIALLSGLAVIIIGMYRVKPFSLDEYQEELSSFASNETVSCITTATEARRTAVNLWKKIYGDNIINKKPFRVYYDKKNDAWLVKGSILFGRDGGVPYAIMQSDGKVLAIWHDK